MDLFPYIPRKFQPEVVRRIRRSVEQGRHFCLHAPTGFGKTPVVLAALLPVGRPIVWVTRTGNQADRPVEELKKINEGAGTDFVGISFRGKRDMCVLAREKSVDYDALNVLCKKCPYRKEGFSVPRKTMSFSEIFNISERAGICPYRFQLELARHADLISMSYNYVFSDLIFMVHKFFRLNEAVLVVDEAHNLQRVVRDLNSDRISRFSVMRAVREAESFSTERSFLLASKLRGVLRFMDGAGQTFSARELLRSAGINQQDMTYLSALGNRIYEVQMAQGKPLRSHLKRLADFLKKAVEVEGEEGVALLSRRGELEIFDMRLADILKDVWAGFHSVVFVSGTLKPIEAFAETVGLKNYDSLTVPSFASSVSAFIIKGVSTRGEEMDEARLMRYRSLISSFFTYPGNVAVFFSSYRIQNLLLPFVNEAARHSLRKLYIEREDLSGSEARGMLEDFREGTNGALIAPCGGRFAEGADFPGKSLEAIMIVGIPFDRFDTKTRMYIDYYSKIYGEKGRYYAYVVPAIRRTAQALGRAIRSPTDFGFFVLADERYAWRNYFELLPDYVQRNARGIHYSNFSFLMQNFNS